MGGGFRRRERCSFLDAFLLEKAGQEVISPFGKEGLKWWRGPSPLHCLPSGHLRKAKLIENGEAHFLVIFFEREIILD